MLQKDLLLQELQKQLHTTEDEQTKIMLNALIGEISAGKYDPRIW